MNQVYHTTPSHPNHQLPHQQMQTKKVTKNSKLKLLFSNKKFLLIGGVVFALIITLIASLLIAANRNKTPEIPPTITISFWGTSIDESVMSPLIADFESKNPYIKVKYEKRSETEYLTRLKARLQSGNSAALPDLFEINEYLITDLNQYLSPITDQNILKEFSGNMIKNNQVAGSTYGVPFNFDSLALAYNEDHFKENNLTQSDFDQLEWSYLINASNKLKRTQKVVDEKTKVEKEELVRGGLAVGSSVNVTNADKILQLLLLQNDVTLFDPVNQRFKFSSSDEADEVLDFYSSFLKENIWSNTLENDIDAFKKGNVSMVMLKASDIYNIKQTAPLLKFKTILPAKIAKLKTLSFGTSISIPGVSPKKNEATKFLSYLSTPENQLKLFNNLDNSQVFVPASLSALNQIPKESIYSVYSDLNPTAESLFIPYYAESSEIFSKFLEIELKAIKPGATSTNIDTSSLESSLNANYLKLKNPVVVPTR